MINLTKEQLETLAYNIREIQRINSDILPLGFGCMENSQTRTARLDSAINCKGFAIGYSIWEDKGLTILVKDLLRHKMYGSLNGCLHHKFYLIDKNSGNIHCKKFYLPPGLVIVNENLTTRTIQL